MIVTKTEHVKSQLYKADKYFDSTHRERFLVKTWWFLFIPVFTSKTIINSNL